jgi:hypothetical protein
VSHSRLLGRLINRCPEIVADVLDDVIGAP